MSDDDAKINIRVEFKRNNYCIIYILIYDIDRFRHRRESWTCEF